MEAVLDLTRRYSYIEYISDIFKEIRCEFLEGFIKLFPSPIAVHARASGNIYSEMKYFLKKQKSNCEVFHSPFEVHFRNGSGEITHNLQPDVLVVCDPEKIQEWCEGTPDLVVEVLSPSTAARDWKDKYDIYEKFGVREYWIVDPYSKTITVFILKDGKFSDAILYEKGKIPVFIFENKCKIDLDYVFNR
ncbi:MAG: Uma2 family endonuclease [Marinilabiliaceae bacterium]|nr:Uma2 family endonuclease [Marinilabiliaceae bacterium]